MATTNVMENLPVTSPIGVGIYVLNQALLKQREFRILEDKTRQSEYIYSSGDPNKETTVLVSSKADAKNNTLRTSISLRTIETTAVDGTVTESSPVVCSISWTTPGAIENTLALMNMIGTAYSLVMNGVTATVPNMGIIDTLNRGVTERIYS